MKRSYMALICITALGCTSEAALSSDSDPVVALSSSLNTLADNLATEAASAVERNEAVRVRINPQEPDVQLSLDNIIRDLHGNTVSQVADGVTRALDGVRQITGGEEISVLDGLGQINIYRGADTLYELLVSCRGKFASDPGWADLTQYLALIPDGSISLPATPAA